MSRIRGLLHPLQLQLNKVSSVIVSHSVLHLCEADAVSCLQLMHMCPALSGS